MRHSRPILRKFSISVCARGRSRPRSARRPSALQASDRHGTFEPRLITKHERRFAGFDDKILALYARGMTVREIQACLGGMYGVEVSPDVISTITDGIAADVTAWPSRPLEPPYPVVFCEALRVKIRDEATVRSKAVALAALGGVPCIRRRTLGAWTLPPTRMIDLRGTIRSCTNQSASLTSASPR